MYYTNNVFEYFTRRMRPNLEVEVRGCLAPLMLPNSATICYNNFVACVITRSLLPSTVGQFMCRSIGALSSVSGTKVLVLGPASTLFCIIDNPQ